MQPNVLQSTNITLASVAFILSGVELVYPIPIMISGITLALLNQLAIQLRAEKFS